MHTLEIDLSTYAKFRPTACDAPGLGCPDRQEWYVSPVSQTRDSGSLERANFDATLRELGGESEFVEVHRFGHWGPGWSEIILISPEAPKLVQIAQELRNLLTEYPVVCESLLSEYEWEDMEQCWDSWGRNEWCEVLKQEHCDDDDSEDHIDNLSDDSLDNLWQSAEGECEHYSDGPVFRFENAAKRLQWSDIRDA